MINKFSVLVPVTTTKFLRTTIRSLRLQQGNCAQNLQLVVFNNGTTESVEEIARSEAGNLVVDFAEFSQTKSDFPTDGWNRALELCRHEFVCLLGDDDCYAPDFFSEMDSLIERHPDGSYFRGKLALIDADDEIIHYGWPMPEFEEWKENLYYRLFRGRPGAIIEHVFRTETLRGIGGYQRIKQAWGSDDLTCLRMAMVNGIYSTNKAIALWRRHDGQISSGRNTSRNLEISRDEYLPLLRRYIDMAPNSTSIEGRHFEAEWRRLTESLEQSPSAAPEVQPTRVERLFEKLFGRR